jgi:hypothetical protein
MTTPGKPLIGKRKLVASSPNREPVDDVEEGDVEEEDGENYEFMDDDLYEVDDFDDFGPVRR